MICSYFELLTLSSEAFAVLLLQEHFPDSYVPHVTAHLCCGAPTLQLGVALSNGQQQQQA